MQHKNVLFCFLIKTHSACLQTVFNYSEVSLCFSDFLFMWGQFDIYWYILEAGDFWNHKVFKLQKNKFKGPNIGR